MNTFSKAIRDKLLSIYNWQCANYKHTKCQGNKGLSFHHIVPNTKTNIKLYGNKHIQSEENALPLCDWCHTHRTEIGWIQLLKNKLINKWKNIS